MDDYKNGIELRSEKVRNIVGQIPSLLLRWGITVTSIVMAMVIAGISIIPYTETITVPVIISVAPNQADVYYGVIYIADKYIETVKKKTKIKIELFGFPISKYGEVEGEISQICSVLKNGAGINVEIYLPHELRTSKGYTIEHLPSLGGYAYITVSKQSIFYRILGTNN